MPQKYVKPYIISLGDTLNEVEGMCISGSVANNPGSNCTPGGVASGAGCNDGTAPGTTGCAQGRSASYFGCIAGTLASAVCSTGTNQY